MRPVVVLGSTVLRTSSCPARRKLVTLRDAALYITKLPKAEHDNPDWQAAMGVREPPKTKAQLREILAEAVRSLCVSRIVAAPASHAAHASLPLGT